MLHGLKIIYFYFQFNLEYLFLNINAKSQTILLTFVNKNMEVKEDKKILLSTSIQVEAVGKITYALAYSYICRRTA